MKHIESLKKAVKSFQKKLNHPKETVRKRNMGNIAERYNSMGRAFLYCDDVASAKKLFEAAYKTLKQGRILDNYRILSSTWDGLSYVAFKSNNVKEFINCRLNYIKNRKMIIQKDSIKAHYTNKDSDFSNLGDYYLKTADWALVLGASPKSITPYFEEAKKLKKVKTKDIKKLIYHHPNLKAVFGNF